MRIDNGSQYTSDYFLKQLAYLGIEDSFGLVRQPETNGVAERFHRTLKEQVINGRVFKNVDEVKEAVKEFATIYNEKWPFRSNCAVRFIHHNGRSFILVGDLLRLTHVVFPKRAQKMCKACFH